MPLSSPVEGDTGSNKTYLMHPYVRAGRARRYLFALVAGDLGSIKDSFTTKSGRKVPPAPNDHATFALLVQESHVACLRMCSLPIVCCSLMSTCSFAHVLSAHVLVYPRVCLCRLPTFSSTCGLPAVLLESPCSLCATGCALPNTHAQAVCRTTYDRLSILGSRGNSTGGPLPHQKAA
jgi:hypothetical protein